MNILVLGATGATGKLLVELALTSGHRVNALVRSPQRLTTGHPNLNVITGDATEASDVARAMQGRSPSSALSARPRERS